MELHEVMKKGGEWLGAVRSWMQWHCINGSNVIWGSDEALRTTHGPLTVKDVEEIGGVAAHAMAEELNAKRRWAFVIYCNDTIQAVYLSDKGQFEGECDATRVMEDMRGEHYKKEYLKEYPSENEYRKDHYWHLQYVKNL